MTTTTTTNKQLDMALAGTEVIKNAFWKSGAVGDFCKGVLIGKRTQPSSFPDAKEKTQTIYEFIAVVDGQYHNILEDKSIAKEPTVIANGEIYSFGSKMRYDNILRKAKMGQEVLIWFKEEMAPKVKGYNKTKVLELRLGKMRPEFLESAPGEAVEDDGTLDPSQVNVAGVPY